MGVGGGGGWGGVWRKYEREREREREEPVKHSMAMAVGNPFAQLIEKALK